MLQAKQNWHLSLDSGFEATRNSRNAAMLHDAAEFARNLRTCEKEIQTLKAVSEGSYSRHDNSSASLVAGTATEPGFAGMLLTTRTVMSACLPRVFEEMEGTGEVRPVEAPSHLNKIGGEFDAEELTAVATSTVRTLLSSLVEVSWLAQLGPLSCPSADLQAEQARKIETEVLGPLSRWEKAYEAVQVCCQQLSMKLGPQTCGSTGTAHPAGRSGHSP